MRYRPLRLLPAEIELVVSGGKTQHRMIMNPQPVWIPSGHTLGGFSHGAGWDWSGFSCWSDTDRFAEEAVKTITVKPGDFFWVCEPDRQTKNAARIHLLITDVRMHRVWSTSEADARREGFAGPDPIMSMANDWRQRHGLNIASSNPWVLAFSFMANINSKARFT